MDRLGEISTILSTVRDKESIEQFFKSILTQKEVSDISSRWELVKLLDQGLSQRSIAKKLGISLCKITRGSKELKKKGSIFKVFIDLHKKRQRD
jgi:TrpR family trp operon transcriptional repressor